MLRCLLQRFDAAIEAQPEMGVHRIGHKRDDEPDPCAGMWWHTPVRVRMSSICGTRGSVELSDLRSEKRRIDVLRAAQRRSGLVRNVGRSGCRPRRA